MPRKTLCQLYEAGDSPFGNSLPPGRYYAASEINELPRAVRRDDHVITHGYAVGFGQWFFFLALEPAVAFGRAARMSTDCPSYGVYEAAAESLYCGTHRTDERVLLVDFDAGVDRSADEVETLKRFVQGVKEHPWSAHWRPPTGFITDYNRGKPVKSSRRSLPL